MARLKATENMVDTANIFFVIIRQRFISFNNKRNYCFTLMCKFILKSCIHDTAIFHHPLKGKKKFFVLIYQFTFQGLQARPACSVAVKAIYTIIKWLKRLRISESSWKLSRSQFSWHSSRTFFPFCRSS